MVKRSCGDCQLCCKLLPVRSLKKGANERCAHQRHRKGCAIYKQLGAISPECRLWSCRWLVSPETAGLARPDRSHYVLDIMPDFIRTEDEGETSHVQVVQIWCDPDYPDAHRDPALRAYLLKLGDDRIAGLVRYGNERAIVIFPPQMMKDRQWCERSSDMRAESHTAAEMLAIGEVLWPDEEIRL